MSRWLDFGRRGVALTLGRPQISQTDYTAEGVVYGSLLNHVTDGRHAKGEQQAASCSSFIVGPDAVVQCNTILGVQCTCTHALVPCNTGQTNIH